MIMPFFFSLVFCSARLSSRSLARLSFSSTWASFEDNEMTTYKQNTGALVQFEVKGGYS